jgi:hypothetical protein
MFQFHHRGTENTEDTEKSEQAVKQIDCLHF